MLNELIIIRIQLNAVQNIRAQRLIMVASIISLTIICVIWIKLGIINSFHFVFLCHLKGKRAHGVKTFQLNISSLSVIWILRANVLWCYE